MNVLTPLSTHTFLPPVHAHTSFPSPRIHISPPSTHTLLSRPSPRTHLFPGGAKEQRYVQALPSGGRRCRLMLTSAALASSLRFKMKLLGSWKTEPSYNRNARSASLTCTACSDEPAAHASSFFWVPVIACIGGITVQPRRCHHLPLRGCMRCAGGPEVVIRSPCCCVRIVRACSYTTKAG